MVVISINGDVNCRQYCCLASEKSTNNNQKLIYKLKDEIISVIGEIKPQL